MTTVTQLRRALTSSWLNVLLLAAPVSWVLRWQGDTSLWTFAVAALSLIPAAGLIGSATEQLAERSGPVLGGFLNATFGNAAELIIAIAALRANHIEVVKASITGSIIGNLLLVFGLACFAGGLKNGTQKFDRTSAGTGTVMLFLATVALVLLGAATALTAVQAEILITALEPALEGLGMTELFAGVIIVALVGNAAEHYSAVTAAVDNQMTLSVEIAVGSSAQIALMVAPLLVLLSYAFGTPMSLVFNAFELTAIGLSVLAIALVSLDGESNWLEGLQLLGVYAIFAVAFYIIPA